MNKKQIDQMLYELLEQIDHDIAKAYHPDTAEEPEFVEDDMEDLRNIVRKYM
jgi:hypothetical protein